MGALTVGFILADYSFNHGNRVLTYIFLGSIVTILFYVLCLHGYQNINWVFLAIVPIYVILSLLAIHFRKVEVSDTSDMCDSCEMPLDHCSCETPNPRPRPVIQECECGKKHSKDDNCPANPITLKTECGISRHSSLYD